MTWTLHNTDCLEGLRQLPDNCVQTCVTSPPYWSLRDYETEGQIGAEATPQEYIARLVEVFHEVRRVLRDDGTCWLNLGDGYAGNMTYGSLDVGFNERWGNRPRQGKQEAAKATVKRRLTDGFKPKDLLGIPWRTAFALQEDGWWLRTDVVWNKPNAKPEAVRDRPTRSHEFIFLLTKSPTYYYDADAIREPMKTKRADALTFKRDHSKYSGKVVPHATVGTHRPDRPDTEAHPLGRNKRDVWTVTTAKLKEAHFAAFPPKLIEPCILAGSRPGDIVLDPFAGAGTTLLVAEKYGRDSIGYELNPKYCDIIRNRLREVQTVMTLA